MSLGTGWDYSDHLQMLLNPSSKKESLKNIGITILLFIPLMGVVFLAFSFSSIFGFLNAGTKTKCDRCGKRFFNTYKGQLWKFYDFCDSCSNEQINIQEKFLHQKRTSKRSSTRRDKWKRHTICQKRILI